MTLIIQSDISLQYYNTLKINVNADKFAEITTVDDLKESISFAHDHGLPHITLGGGSNIILKNDLHALVAVIKIADIEKIKETATHVLLRIGAGENWDNLVSYCLENHYFGIENLSLIPGTMGAAPIQNIGAYGVELKNIFYSLDALEKKSLILKTFYVDDCQFQYRDSVFKKDLKDQYVITAVTLKLSKAPNVTLIDKTILNILADEKITTPTPLQLREIVCRIRRSRLPDPNELGNVGSFFLNPLVTKTIYQSVATQYSDIIAYPASDNMMKISAGWLIRQSGWHNYRNETCGVYEKNSLVLVNYDKATGNEMLNLAQQIKESVFKQFNIMLEIEPRVYG